MLRCSFVASVIGSQQVLVVVPIQGFRAEPSTSIKCEPPIISCGILLVLTQKLKFILWTAGHYRCLQKNTHRDAFLIVLLMHSTSKHNMWRIKEQTKKHKHVT